ncbi:hypothetical protein VNO77_14412 [Canavalia gladiata]|uniref:Uncharacterized protein n=1 Tax=Canavalia gladiata TaxID=3824 RepID=A0AAN9LYR9_CANGL
MGETPLYGTGRLVGYDGVSTLLLDSQLSSTDSVPVLPLPIEVAKLSSFRLFGVHRTSDSVIVDYNNPYYRLTLCARGRPVGESVEWTFVLLRSGNTLPRVGWKASEPFGYAIFRLQVLLKKYHDYVRVLLKRAGYEDDQARLAGSNPLAHVPELISIKDYIFLVLR